MNGIDVFRTWRCAVAMLTLAALAGCGGGGGAAGPANPAPAPGIPGAPPPAPPPAAPADPATVSFLHVFGVRQGDARGPGGPLLLASDGNFYGTSLSSNGVCNAPDPLPCGTVFRVSAAGEAAVLYTFGSSANDGYVPAGRLVQGKDGALYGTTTHGGAHGGGTVFRITLDGAYTSLHSFGRTPDDGVSPIGGLLQASDGNFYGATNVGGANQCPQTPSLGWGNCGTIFRMTPGGAITILHSFGASVSDGVSPNGALVEGADGHLYGTTASGGAYTCTTAADPVDLHNCGTAFRITRDGRVTILHSFGSTPADGKAPLGGLILGQDGAFYGTTVSGGPLFGMCRSVFGCGTLFRLTAGGSVSMVYTFGKTAEDGHGPSAHLVQGRDGSFYGTTSSGGAAGGDASGTAFRITPAGASTTLFSFGPLNDKPSRPEGLTLGRDGAFYGVTGESGRLGAVGAQYGGGTFYRLVVNGAP